MEVIKEFLLNHLQLISFITVSIGLILLTVYIVMPHFRGFSILKRDDKAWLKDLQPYLDEDGKLVFEKLAKIWVEGSVKNKYTKEDIKYIWEKAIDEAFLPYIRKTEAVMAEHVRPLDIDDEEYYQKEDPIELAYKKVPKDEILAIFTDEIFNHSIPGIEDLTEEEKDNLKQEVIEYFIKKYNTIGDIKEEEVIEYYKSLVEKKAGSSLSVRKIEEDIDKEVEEAKQQQRQKLLFAIERTKKLVSETLAESTRTYSDNTTGNLPDNIKEIFISLGFDNDVVNRIKISKVDMMYYESKFPYIYEDNFIILMGFLNAVINKNILPLFIREKYDVSKVIKDYFLFCLDNYIPGKDSKESYNKFLRTSRFLFFLKNVNPQGYNKFISENPQIPKFLPIVMSCLFEEYESDLLPEFLRFLKENINIKRPNMIVKDVSEFAKEDQVKEVFFDKIGFTYERKIYLFPKAVNIYFGEYFLAVPYILNGLLEFFFHEGFDIYAMPHLIMYKTEGKVYETIKILSKIIDEEGISEAIYNSLDNKQVQISEYKNIVGIKPHTGRV